MKKLMWLNLVLVLTSRVSVTTVAKTSAETYDVRQFGAIGDGQTLNTQAIQKAIDVCAEAGGGTVYFPAGSYKAGTCYLKSNVTLYLESGATLLQSKDMKHYIRPEKKSYVHHLACHYSFLHGSNVKNVSITGEGTLDGNMALDHGSRGPITVNFENSEDILIKDVTVVDSGGGAAVNFFGCKRIDIIGVKCINSFAGALNISCCQDFLCDGVLVDKSKDDPICLKNDSTDYSYETRPDCGYLSKDIIITNTTIRDTGHPAIKFGSGTYGVFRNIVVSDCTFENTGVMFSIQLYWPNLEGNPERLIENVTFSNIKMRNVRSLFDWATMPEVIRPVIRNISVKNIIADGVNYPSIIAGLSNAPIRDLTLNDIKVTYRGDPASYWLKARYVQGLKLSNVQLQLAGAVKSALICGNGRELELDNVNVKGVIGTEPVIKLNQVNGVSIYNSRSPAVETFLYAEGDETEDISFAGNDLSKAKIPFTVSEEARKATVLPAAGKVEYSNLGVSKEINANERFKVNVTLTNTGDAGAFKTEVYVDGEVAGSKWLWLEKGQSRQVTLATRRYYEPQSHKIGLGPLTATAAVKPTPAAFGFGDKMQVISPAEAGEQTTIKVTLKNIGGYEGTKEVKLYADGKVVTSKKVTLGPGIEKEITIEHKFKEAAHRLKIDDLPAWPFATFANTEANFYQTREKIIIEADGGRYNFYSRKGNKYGAVYLKDVEGDFVATVKLLTQQAGGPYAMVGLIARNDVTKPGESAGYASLHWRPTWGGTAGWAADREGDGNLDTKLNYYCWGYPPIWFKMEKKGNTFTGYISNTGTLWTIVRGYNTQGAIATEGVYKIGSADTVQDVGIFGNAYSVENKLCRVELQDFKLEKPIPEQAVKYTDLKVSKTELKPDETFTASATVTNTSSVKGPAKVGFYIDGHEPYTKWIELEPGESRQVEFSTTLEGIEPLEGALWAIVGPDYLPGTHQVTLGTATPKTITITGLKQE